MGAALLLSRETKMSRRNEDAALFVRFERKSVLNKARSYGETILDNENKVATKIEGSGKPEFDNVDYILIQIPGDKDCVPHRPATFCGGAQHINDPEVWRGPCRAPPDTNGKPRLEECDVHRFQDEWERYKAGQTEQTIGTPLRSWPGIDPASVDELAYHKVYTVEQLAGINDSNAEKFFSLRQRAKDFLEAAKKAIGVQQFRAEMEAKDQQLKALQDQVNQLIAGQARGDKLIQKEAKR
jgi:hypothetical protein